MDGGRYGFMESAGVRKTYAKTVNGAFTTFLDNEINIASGAREQATASHLHLREFISGENGRDEDFPRILSIADDDFLGGSFPRHVKLWPLDDIDVYLPIDGVGLVYTVGGLAQADKVLTDGVLTTNPLCNASDRWMTDSNVSPRKVIAGFRKVLGRKYSMSKSVRSVGEAVRIQLTIAGGLGFDVVPCFSLERQTFPRERFYMIPDGSDEWITTNPREDQRLSDSLQKTNNSLFRPAVTVVKWWVRNRYSERLTSYYTELAIMRAVEQFNRVTGPLVSLSQSVVIAFNAVRSAAWGGDQMALVRGAPPVKRGEIDIPTLWVLDATANDAAAALALELQGHEEDAIDKWQSIFGESFPGSI